MSEEPKSADIVEAARKLFGDNKSKNNATRRRPTSVCNTKACDGISQYAQKALEDEYAAMASTAEGSRNDQLNTSAFNLGQLVGSGELSEVLVIERLTAAAEHSGLGAKEIESTLASGLDAGKAEPRPPRAVSQVPPAYSLDPNEVGAQDNDEQPRYTDFAALLAGGLPEPPKPSVLSRADGVGIFYRAKRNELYGDPEAGKTMLTFAAIADELATGGRVVFIDLDNNGQIETAERLLMLGVPKAALIDPNRLRHCEPQSADEVVAIVKDCAGWATLAPIDCVGELLPLFGANSDKADDYTRVMQRVAGPLEKGGAAVVLIDHQAKGVDSRRYGAGGTMAKRRAVSGTSINLVRKATFIPGRGGIAELYINKDRPGGLRRHCPQGDGGGRQFAGTFILDPPDASPTLAAWRIEPGRVDSPAHTIDPRVERYHAVAAEGDGSVTAYDLAVRVNGLEAGTPPTRAMKQEARRSAEKLADQGRFELVDEHPRRWRVVSDEHPNIVRKRAQTKGTGPFECKGHRKGHKGTRHGQNR